MERKAYLKFLFPPGFERKTFSPPKAGTVPVQHGGIAAGGTITEDFGDRDRTISRYKNAAIELKQSINTSQGPLRSFIIEGLTDEPGDFDDAQFRTQINLALTSKEAEIKDQASWARCKNTIECIFKALSPFAKNFLTVAKEAQSVQSLRCA